MFLGIGWSITSVTIKSNNDYPGYVGAYKTNEIIKLHLLALYSIFKL
jgi:hypothetical protein